jgi:hypothetical protein
VPVVPFIRRGFSDAEPWITFRQIDETDLRPTLVLAEAPIREAVSLGETSSGIPIPIHRVTFRLERLLSNYGGGGFAYVEEPMRVEDISGAIRDQVRLGQEFLAVASAHQSRGAIYQGTLNYINRRIEEGVARVPQLETQAQMMSANPGATIQLRGIFFCETCGRSIPPSGVIVTHSLMEDAYDFHVTCHGKGTKVRVTGMEMAMGGVGAWRNVFPPEAIILRVRNAWDRVSDDGFLEERA